MTEAHARQVVKEAAEEQLEGRGWYVWDGRHEKYGRELAEAMLLLSTGSLYADTIKEEMA